jgi:hypothetical protein
MEYRPIVDILEEVFGDYRLHTDYKGQISFDCPVCSYEIKGLDETDGKGNLEINYHRRVYKCWSCSETYGTYGSIYKLVRKYGTKKQWDKFELLMPEVDEEGVPKPPKKQVQLPSEFIPFTTDDQSIRSAYNFKQAHNYITSRGVTDEIVRKYNIGFCCEGAYAFRIIIPSYSKKGKLNYFIARSYLKTPRLKYKNPDVQKETIIWNEHLIDWSKRVYLVEGAFDSIFLPNSIAMLGKHLSPMLFDKLYESGCDVTIVLDGDAWDDAEKLYHRLNCGKMMGKVKVIKLPMEEDIADLRGNLIKYNEYQLD